ncbi:MULTISPECIES: DUF433 domain-containing protein [unclassified Microcoleus]|uniref:DUF433 domain-containing protein n=1 Tax=unclassified Microcoleus TaxID=2642155 RepID=UPI001D79719E|nr:MULTISPECIES: DUF433 domain-containing protein [unclassified Microcoleus]MCC3445061.1 DUF433 domain-containing protein [Microcoleus sp. PH2017_03_ELD_O_A]MCC3469979.1 DUF433 domain-containing protein [Microcoleus sp. PH2017_06_SFM_O_A]MCC3507307.1 DUF433 domain-containing protein [Microcoleus sp. PH2017_19_SFW_U_A]TAE06348.1 MAG: DUF433 domain-containing protein [Oscillatoriales cyanobacterium]MCC3415619.1 DUF433 domain-containing protein [Microcoleus sp. PH2017_02_FOX_O_A]
MQLEDYFEFLDPDDIRIKGHRIGIDDVIKYYLDGYSPDQILVELPTLNLEKIYATLTYYLQNRRQMDAYMLRLAKWREERYQEWLAKEPSDVVKRLRAIKAQREQELILLK